MTDLSDVISATNTVVDWFTLGIFLKVDFKELKTIDTNYSGNVKRRRQEMLALWVCSGNATWSTLVNVLCCDSVNEKGVAEDIKEKYL